MKVTKSRRKVHLIGSVVVLLLALSCYASEAVNIPQSPCPSIFDYKWDGEEYFGLFLLTGHLGHNVKIRLLLSLAGLLPTTFPGAIDLYAPNDETVEYLVNKRPIPFKIVFPLQHILPQVKRIFINNKLVCSGEPDWAPRRTNIVLEYTLNELQTENHDSNLRNDDSPSVPTARPPNPVTSRPIPETPHVNRLPKEPIPDKDETDDVDEGVTNSLDDVCSTVDSEFNDQPLIAGGEYILRGSWPWLAAIYSASQATLRFQCGGSLISKILVLTSAHCLYYVDSRRHSAQNIIVYLGHYNIDKWIEKGAVIAEVNGIYIHPDYKPNSRSYDADIAVVLLQDEVRFTKLIRPVCLWPNASTTDEIAGQHGAVVGWGGNEAGQRITNMPKRIETTIVSDVECLRSNEHFQAITSNRTFCAGDRGGKGPCRGDSGGGLMILRDGKWRLRGIVSATLHGNDCNLKEYVVYADVSKFLPWIKSYMQQSRPTKNGTTSIESSV